MAKIDEHQGKRCLMIYYYMVEKALQKIKKKTLIETFDDTKILIDTDNKLSDGIKL